MPETQAERTTWFPSRVDGWVAAALGLAPAVSLGAAALEALAGRPTEAWIALGGAALLAALYGLLVLPMRYGVGRDALVVRFGVLRQRIPLAGIRAVRPTTRPLGAPALSLRRLRIDWTDGRARTVMISPADREGFLALLAARAGLARRGDELVREEP